MAQFWTKDKIDAANNKKSPYNKESYGRDEVAKMFGFGDKRMDFGGDVERAREFAAGGGDQKVPDLADDPLTKRRMSAVRSEILRGADAASSGFARSQGGGSGSSSSAARRFAIRANAGGAASRAADDVMQGERMFRAEIDRGNLDRRQRSMADILGFGTSWRGQNVSLLGLLDDRAKTQLGLDDSQKNRDLQEKIARWQFLNRKQPTSFVSSPQHPSAKPDDDSDGAAPPTDGGGGGGTGSGVTDASDVDTVLASRAAAPKGKLAWRRRV